MRHVRALRFDALEDRKLLSAAHHAAKPHTQPMIPAGTPLALNGTLAVDNALTTSMDNVDGSSTTSTPLVGTLGSLGRVSGVWNETLDQYGDSTGFNVLRLQDAKGTLIITFNTTNTVKAHPAGHNTVYYTRAQKLYTATGAYAGDTESGMIEMTTNASKSEIVSLTLKSAT